MKYLFSLGMLLVVNVLIATALPKSFSIKGRLIEATEGLALEFATVSAYRSDSIFVNGTVTDKEGKFDLRLQEGSYQLKINFIGFENKYIPLVVRQDSNLGLISLTNEGLSLDEVNITAEQSQLSLKLDKKVFNVGKDLLSMGGSATEVLENVPSVTVDPGGAISLRGNSGVTILINGKPSALATNNALSTIPASSIEKVEVITNPSARYESAGTVGIINIVLKANSKRGFNGSASLNAGLPADHQANFSFNMRRSKFNFFGNVGGRFANFIGRAESERISSLNSNSASFQMQSRQNRNDKAVFGFVGLDYFINEKQSLTASYSNYTVTNTDQTLTNFRYVDGVGELSQELDQTFDYLEPESYHQIDLTHSWNFGNSKNKKWTTTFQHDFWFNDERENMLYTERFPSELDQFQLRTHTIESSRDYLLQSDFTTEFGEKGLFEAGLRAETRVISSDFIAELRNEDDWEIYNQLDNELNYYERIAGAYAQYGQRLGKFNYLLGLRTEYTFVNVVLENSEDFKKEYTRLFPTANLSYQLTDATAFQISYSRRIQRPRFWQLNPFGGLSDPNQIFQGNPDMDPSYTDRLELNMVQTWEKLSLNPAIYYGRTLDFFGSYLWQEADGLVRELPVNLDQNQNLGIELIANFRPSKAVNINGELNWTRYKQQGIYEQQDFDFQASVLNGSLSIQYQFLNNFSFQARGSYQGNFQNAIGERKPVLYANLGLSRQLLKKKMTISLRVNNVFDSRWYRNITTQPTFLQEHSRAWTGRRWGLNITYNFQSGEAGQLRRARGSIR